MRVPVSNTNLAGLDAIRETFGGSLTRMKTHNRPNNRIAYQLTWNSRRGEGLLGLVGPPLVLKRPQYLLLLEFMQARRKNRRLGGSNGRLDPSEVELRDSFPQRLKNLNRKGPRETDIGSVPAVDHQPRRPKSPRRAGTSRST